MSVLNSLIYLVDNIGMSHCAAHFMCGISFGFFFGLFNPVRAFWAAFFIGFSKETVDFLKHTFTEDSFHFLTDPHYGLYDGLEDLLLWMMGGYVAYQLLN